MSQIIKRIVSTAIVCSLLGLLNVVQAQSQPADPGPDPDPNTVTTWYRDFDGDGFGDPKRKVDGPVQPPGYVSNNLDCNDYKIHYEDQDRDGWGNSTKVPCGLIVRTGDCNDNDPKIHSLQTFYRDADGDWYGDINNMIKQCTNTPPAGYVRNSIDCNDNDKGVYWPKAYYADADGDGLGDPNKSIAVCSSTPPTGYVANKKDTDDTPPAPITARAGNKRMSAANAPTDVLKSSSFSISAYPNPARKQTQIFYTLAAEAQVRIQVIDLLGREVGVVFSGRRSAGAYTVSYNTEKLASGFYYCRMIATANGRDVVQTCKLAKAE